MFIHIDISVHALINSLKGIIQFSGNTLLSLMGNEK